MLFAAQNTYAFKIIAVILTLALCGCGDKNQFDEKNLINSFNVREYSSLKLKGDVKTLEMTTYDKDGSITIWNHFEFNERRETTKRKTIEQGKTHTLELTEYSENGTELSSEWYEGGILRERSITEEYLDEDGEVERKIEMTYDESKKLISEYEVLLKSKGDTIKKSVTRWEDGRFSHYLRLRGEGKSTESISYDYSSDSIQTRKWYRKTNSMGKTVLEERYSTGNRLDYKKIFKYDTLGNLIERLTFQRDTNSLNEKTVVNYDARGMKKDSIFYYYGYGIQNPNPEDTAAYQQIHEFDEHGNVIRRTFKSQGEVEQHNTLEYGKGNKLKKEIINHSSGGVTKIKYDKYGNEVYLQYFDDKNNLEYEKKHKIWYDRYGNITTIQLIEDDTLRVTNHRRYQYH